MTGTIKLPNGPMKNVMVVRIIIMPCMLTIVLYVPGPNSFAPGRISSRRISIAPRPPRASMMRVKTRYWMPTTLWSVVKRK